MCTRFYILPETEEIKGYLDRARASRLADRFLRLGSPLLTSGEIRPTNVVPVLAPDPSGREDVFPMKWGFRFPGRPVLVNARSETAAVKPAFRESWERRRCVIPASWYYEWEHLTDSAGRRKTGDRYMIQPRGSAVTWLCGLYRLEEGLPCFTVLTREPSEDLAGLHDRMPLILPEDLAHEWIRPGARPEELVRHACTDMAAEKG